jgi:hypothetical protein
MTVKEKLFAMVNEKKAIPAKISALCVEYNELVFEEGEEAAQKLEQNIEAERKLLAREKELTQLIREIRLSTDPTIFESWKKEYFAA